MTPRRRANSSGQRRAGSESKDVFKKRLMAEDRWKEYSEEREALSLAQGCTLTAAHNLIHHKYQPGMTTQISATAPHSTAATGIEELFKDVLPNGCPLFEESRWKGRPTTNLLEDVQWVASHLGLKDFDYINRAPSLRACTLYWEARYTLAGMQRYQDLLQQLEVPDKATLKQLNSRRDDGEELNLLNSFIQNYDQHQSGQ